MRKQLKESSCQKASLKACNADVTSKVGELQSEKNNLDSRLVESTQLLESTREQLRHTRSDLEQQLAEARRKLDAANTVAKQWACKYKECEDELSNKISECERKSTKSISKLQQQETHIKELTADLKQAHKDWKCEVASLRRDKQQNTAEREKVTQQVVEMKAVADASTSRVEQLVRDKTMQTQQISQKDTQIANMKSKLKDAEAAVVQRDENCQALRNELITIRGERDTLTV